jgi:hypothetical protein
VVVVVVVMAPASHERSIHKQLLVDSELNKKEKKNLEARDVFNISSPVHCPSLCGGIQSSQVKTSILVIHPPISESSIHGRKDL